MVLKRAAKVFPQDEHLCNYNNYKYNRSNHSNHSIPGQCTAKVMGLNCKSLVQQNHLHYGINLCVMVKLQQLMHARKMSAR